MLRWQWTPLLVAIAAACGPSEQPAPPAAELDGEPVALLDFVTVAPPDWLSQPPSSQMRLAEFATPPADGAEPGEVVVYFFGQGQGGTVEANAERWKAQFFDDAGNNVEPAIRRLNDTTFPTTTVELRGRYSRNVGMVGGEEDAKPDQVLLAAIVETPQGSLFLQLHGPSASVDAQRDAFLRFVSRIRSHAQSA